jgi:hypothetical protein
MNDPKQNPNTDQTEKVIRSPLLASICAAVCVFSSIVAFFFAGWFRFTSDPEIACWISTVISEYDALIPDAVFLNMFVLSIASFAGYLFTGALNKKLGIILLAIPTISGILYLITMIPRWTGVYFIPFFIRQDLIGNTGLDDLPYYAWFFLTIFVIPIVFLVGTLQAKTIPAWKSFVLLVAPFFVFLFLGISLIIVGISSKGYAFVLSRGMAFWILFAVVIFSELIRTKVKKIYVWLSIILSAGAVVLSVIVIFVMSFWLYQKATAHKNAWSGRADDPCRYSRKF